MVKQFMNYKGQMTDAPEDLPNEVFSYDNGLIVWSRNKKKHQVRYGLQVKMFTDDLDAAEEVGRCLRHAVECEGKLDIGGK